VHQFGKREGYSVLEVIEASRRVSDRPIEARKEPPRPGDPSHLVACSEKARRVLSDFGLTMDEFERIGEQRDERRRG